MAASYTISGARRTYLNGQYALAGECNGKPAYQLAAGGYVLLQPNNRSYWIVGTSSRLADCGRLGWANSDGNGGSCPASPDGAGCEGLWQELNTTLLWQNAPALAVSGG